MSTTESAPDPPESPPHKPKKRALRGTPQGNKTAPSQFVSAGGSSGPENLSIIPRTIAPGTAAWEKQNWETDISYNCFQAYIALGPMNRSLDLVAETFYPEKSAKAVKHGLRPKSATNVSRWSTENLWKARATKWDEHLHAIARQAQIDEIREMNKEQARRFHRLQEIAEDKLELLACEERLPSFQDVTKMLLEGAKGERVARGAGDAFTNGNGTSNGGPGSGNLSVTINTQYNLKNLTDTELEALAQLQAKLMPVLPNEILPGFNGSGDN